MYDIIKMLSSYYNSSDFRKFQNTFAQNIYESLAISYSNSDSEVKMVTDMSNAVNGKSFDHLKIYSKKIHGTRSFVEFNNQDKPITKELADMVIISLVTKDREILYEKTAFIQNKKEEIDGVWKIDQDQLYLLRNFPTFRGKKGIFKQSFSDEVVFLNHSETLGNYGLFQSPGEMHLVNASSVYKLQQNDKISLSEIIKCNNYSNNIDLQISLSDQPFLNDMIYICYKKFGVPFQNLPFLNTRIASFGIYEFVRNWTLFNIGEVVRVYGKVVDEDLSTFNRILLNSLGFSNFINTKIDAPEFENSMIVFVSHLNLDER